MIQFSRVLYYDLQIQNYYDGHVEWNCREVKYEHQSEDDCVELVLQSDGRHVENGVREDDGRGSSFMVDRDQGD